MTRDTPEAFRTAPMKDGIRYNSRGEPITRDTPEVALAWAWHGLRNGRRELPCKVCRSEAAAILAALDGWTLVPSDEMTGTRALATALEAKQAEIERLRDEPLILLDDLLSAKAQIEAMSSDAADLIDLMDEAAALRTALAHVLVRTHDTGCGTCDAARSLLTTAHELPSRAALAPSEHKPGDPHQYRITCEVCGERGTIRLSVDPETALAPAPSEPQEADHAL